MMAHTVFQKRYFRLSRTQIAYLRFILESYDGLAFVRTLDSQGALVEIGYPLLRAKDAEELLDALSMEISMIELTDIPRHVYRAL